MLKRLRFAQKFVDWENSATDKNLGKEVEKVFDGNAKTSREAVETIIARCQSSDLRQPE